MNRKHIQFISQLGRMDCGIACLAMMFNYYGCKTSVVDIGKRVHIGRDGVSLSSMKKLCNDYGFSFSAFRCEYASSDFDSRLPAIICSGNHYIVVESRNRRGKYLVLDPASGRHIVDRSFFASNENVIVVRVVPENIIKSSINNNRHISIDVRPHQVVKIIILMLLLQAIGLSVPFFVREIIDDLSNGYDFNYLLILTWTCFLSLIYFALNWCRQELLLKMDIKIYREMIYSMIDKLFNLDVNFFEWHSSGDIGNRFNSVGQLNDIITNGMIEVVMQVVTSLFCLISMICISVKLTVLVFPISIMQVFVMILLNRKNIDDTREYFGKQSVLQGKLIDILENMIEIKCIGASAVVCRKLKCEHEKTIDSFRRKSKTTNLMQRFVMTISLVYPLMIYTIGGFLIRDGNMTIGSLIAYVTLFGLFSSPFSSVVMLLPSITTMKETVLRYNEIVEFRETFNSSEIIPASFDTIKAQNISYSYSQNDNSTLSNITLEINRGDRIALVGESGSGKTTMLKVLIGAIKPSKGRIIIDSKNINGIPVNQVSDCFCIVTQNALCFDTTIRENIDLTGTFSDEIIWRALEAAELKEDVEKMPLGLNTLVGENGHNLSGGQKQRVAIARAWISDADVFIFDEATSNLDPITEKKIYCRLKERGKTQIIVTHRMSSIQDADRIYVFSKGKIIEEGSHNNLMKRRGWYYKGVIGC